jgi:hypothetical protein
MDDDGIGTLPCEIGYTTNSQGIFFKPGGSPKLNTGF